MELSKRYENALNFIKSGNSFKALEIMHILGDKYFVDEITNRVTPSEFGKVKDELELAITDEKYRFKDGKQSYCPISTAKFCLLDLLELLFSNDDFKFYPLKDEFNYNLINSKKEVKDGYPKFIPDKSSSCTFDALNWHSEFLNLSILTRINGIIMLNDEITNDNQIIKKPKSLPEFIKTFQWKNFTIIKDGKLNVDVLPIKGSMPLLKKLKSNGLINDKELDINKIYNIDLTSLPILNYSIYNYPISSNLIITNYINQVTLEARLKVMKYFKDQLSKEEEIKKGEIKNDEELYLKLSGIKKDGSYSPPLISSTEKEKEDNISFTIAIKGLSSFPSIKDVNKRTIEIENAIKSNTKIPTYTFGMSILHYYITEIQNKIGGLKENNEKINWLENETFILKKRIKMLKNKIQKYKFSLLLGKSWFTDLTEQKSEYVLPYSTNKLGDDSNKNIDVIFRIHRI